MKRTVVRVVALAVAVAISAVVLADHFGAFSLSVNGQELHGPVLAVAAGSATVVVLLALALMLLLLSATLWGVSIGVAGVFIAVCAALLAAGWALAIPLVIFAAAAYVILRALAVRRPSAV
jgi:hypothetical protein